jgi:hypothetical protein
MEFSDNGAGIRGGLRGEGLADDLDSLSLGKESTIGGNHHASVLFVPVLDSRVPVYCSLICARKVPQRQSTREKRPSEPRWRPIELGQLGQQTIS